MSISIASLAFSGLSSGIEIQPVNCSNVPSCFPVTFEPVHATFDAGGLISMASAGFAGIVAGLPVAALAVLLAVVALAVGFAVTAAVGLVLPTLAGGTVVDGSSQATT